MNADLYAALLLEVRDVAAGRSNIALPAGAETWDQVSAGDVKFITSRGWHLTFFNDVDSVDYLDSAVSPTGVTIDFDDMKQDNCVNVIDRLSSEEHDALERVLKAAR